MERRRFLAVATGTLVALAGCSGDGDGGGSETYGDWFSNVDNYDGEVDMTDSTSVTVRVGADDGFAFEPAAIQVSPGTTVTWRWTGNGGQHNVVARDGSFRSEFQSEKGATFEHRFGKRGLFPYLCEPHEGLGMKGGVRVV